MKREFLENLKIGDQALSKELIDTIMAENGRDIESAKKPFADYEAIKEQLKTAQDGLKAFEGVDVKDLQDKIKTLNTQLSTKDKEWQGPQCQGYFRAAGCREAEEVYQSGRGYQGCSGGSEEG